MNLIYLLVDKKVNKDVCNLIVDKYLSECDLTFIIKALLNEQNSHNIALTIRSQKIVRNEIIKNDYVSLYKYMNNYDKYIFGYANYYLPKSDDILYLCLRNKSIKLFKHIIENTQKIPFSLYKYLVYEWQEDEYCKKIILEALEIVLKNRNKCYDFNCGKLCNSNDKEITEIICKNVPIKLWTNRMRKKYLKRYVKIDEYGNKSVKLKVDVPLFDLI